MIFWVIKLTAIELNKNVEKVWKIQMYTENVMSSFKTEEKNLLCLVIGQLSKNRFFFVHLLKVWSFKNNLDLHTFVTFENILFSTFFMWKHF